MNLNICNNNPAPTTPHSDYMNLDSLHATPTETPTHTPTHTLKHSASCQGNYMNIDSLSRKFEKSASVEFPGGMCELSEIADVGSYGNYMNIPAFTEVTQKAAVNAPIYDTPTNHIRSTYANVDAKKIGMSVSNPIYGSCGTQKLQT